jgi:hypothetical protein
MMNMMNNRGVMIDSSKQNYQQQQLQRNNSVGGCRNGFGVNNVVKKSIEPPTTSQQLHQRSQHVEKTLPSGPAAY